MSKRLVQKSRTGSNSNIEEVGNGHYTVLKLGCIQCCYCLYFNTSSDV